MKNGEIARARNCYDRGGISRGTTTRRQRARSDAYTNFALDHIPKGRRAEEVYGKFVAFERRYGDKEGIEHAIVGWRNGC